MGTLVTRGERAGETETDEHPVWTFFMTSPWWALCVFFVVALYASSQHDWWKYPAWLVTGIWFSVFVERGNKRWGKGK